MLTITTFSNSKVILITIDLFEMGGTRRGEIKTRNYGGKLKINNRNNGGMSIWKNDPLQNDNSIKHILTTLLEDEKQVVLDNKWPIYLDSE
jgi:hypothetical protein